MVDTFTQREVKPSNQPQEYLRVDYNADAYGAQVGRALQGLGQSMDNFAAVQAALTDEKKANDALTYANKAKDEMRPMLFDSTYGAFAQKGGNAMDVDKTTNAALDNIKNKYLKEITDPKTKEAFTKLWLKEEEATKDSVARHQLDELGNYKNETNKATLLNSVQDAYNYYNDDKALERAVASAEKAIDVNTIGMPPEVVAGAKAAAKSSIYLAAISRWAAEDPNKALEFYTENKDKLSGQDHVTATSFVDTAKRVNNAQAKVAQITMSGSAASNLYNAVEHAESGGQVDAKSSAGALGLMQIMPGTAREVAIKLGRPDIAEMADAELENLLRTDANLNRQFGQTYLNQQLVKYNGDVEAALVAYNAGPEWADKFLKENAGKPPGQRDYSLVKDNPKLVSQTEPYVRKVLGQMGVGGTPAGTRMTKENWSLEHFQPSDLMAPTAGGQWVDARAAQALDDLAGVMASKYGVKVSVNEQHNFDPASGTAGKRRGTADPTDNPHVKKSQHLKGDAFDVQVQGWSDEQKAAFLAEARARGFGGVGFYGPEGHLHIDMGNERTWGSQPAWAAEAMKVPVGAAPGGAPQQGPTLPGGSFNNNPAQNFAIPGTFGSQGVFVNPNATNLGLWLQQAQTIADPTERSQVEQMLRLEAANRDAANEAAVNKLKQTAWETTINGSVRDLPADIISQLNPEFVSQLYTYESHKTSGKMPMDWKSWSSVMSMPEQELAKVDAYTEYRNKLDDAHFDQLLKLQKEAQNKLSGKSYDQELLANTRTRSEILKDVFASTGWSDQKSSSYNPANIAKFNELMDQRILGEQAARGKALTATDIQDIADKLLITDKYDGWGYDKNDPAFKITDPTNYVAATSWDGVQADDQKTLIERYQRTYGSVPDQETATDYYNRAMRVYLGGKAEGPEEEKAAYRSAIEQKLNRTLTNEEFDTYYGKYLLKFLGR